MLPARTLMDRVLHLNISPFCTILTHLIFFLSYTFICSFEIYLFIYLVHAFSPDREFHEERKEADFIHHYIVTIWYFMSGSKQYLLKE